MAGANNNRWPSESRLMLRNAQTSTTFDSGDALRRFVRQTSDVSRDLVIEFRETLLQSLRHVPLTERPTP